MPVVELSIKEDYVPWWGTWEGVREIVQNAIDAEKMYGAQMEIGYREGTLQVKNTGCTLTREALLLGQTDKTDDNDSIGQFGEGLKLGVLALVRKGRQVKIHTGGEVWIPRIERSKSFQANVLTFSCISRPKNVREVRIEIEVTPEEWAIYSKNFLKILPCNKQMRHEVADYGELLLDPAMSGKTFVKGIFVRHDPKQHYGYNFAQCKVDRDRQMVDYYDANSARRRILIDAVCANPTLLLEQFYQMLSSKSEEVAGFSQYNADMIPESLRKLLAARFRKVYGKAIPVASQAEATDLEHLGERGAVVESPALRAILAIECGDANSVMKRLQNEITNEYDAEALTDAERSNLNRAIKLVSAAIKQPIDQQVKIVDFRSKTLLGQHFPQKFLLARKILNNRSCTLETLIHEVAHEQGHDGEFKHVNQIETIWAAVVELIS